MCCSRGSCSRACRRNGWFGFVLLAFLLLLVGVLVFFLFVVWHLRHDSLWLSERVLLTVTFIAVMLVRLKLHLGELKDTYKRVFQALNNGQARANSLRRSADQHLRNANQRKEQTARGVTQPIPDLEGQLSLQANALGQKRQKDHVYLASGQYDRDRCQTLRGEAKQEEVLSARDAARFLRGAWLAFNLNLMEANLLLIVLVFGIAGKDWPPTLALVFVDLFMLAKDYYEQTTSNNFPPEEQARGGTPTGSETSYV